MLPLTEIFSPVQLLAWVGGLLYFISYQKQSSDKTIMFWAPADIMFALHFYFVGAPLFIMIALGSTMRSLIALKYSKKVLRLYLIVYLLMIFVAVAFLGDGLKDYAGVLGTIFFSASVWVKQNFVWHRLFALGHQICWITVFLILESYGGLVFTGLICLSNITGTGRYLLKNNKP